MVNKERLDCLQNISREIYNRIITAQASISYDAEYTDLWNTWDKLLHASTMFDNALFNLAQEWRDDGKGNS